MRSGWFAGVKSDGRLDPAVANCVTFHLVFLPNSIWLVPLSRCRQLLIVSAISAPSAFQLLRCWASSLNLEQQRATAMQHCAADDRRRTRCAVEFAARRCARYTFNNVLGRWSLSRRFKTPTNQRMHAESSSVSWAMVAQLLGPGDPGRYPTESCVSH